MAVFSPHKNAIVLNPWMLRIAVACCFLGHGILAIKNSSIYFSEWSTWIQSLFAEEQKYAYSQLLLRTIGAIDILVGLSFLAPRIPKLSFAWAIGWASATALSRLYFLGLLSPPYFQNIVYPISEFLLRVPNWMVPLLLLVHLNGRRPGFSRLNVNLCLAIAVAAQMLGITLHYLVEFNHEIFPFEINKIGMQLWYFHLTGLTACAALVGVVGATNFECGKIGGLLSAVLVLSAYLLVEGYDILIRNTPHGFEFTIIRVLEHIPIYVCIGYFVCAAFNSFNHHYHRLTFRGDRMRHLPRKE